MQFKPREHSNFCRISSANAPRLIKLDKPTEPPSSPIQDLEEERLEVSNAPINKEEDSNLPIDLITIREITINKEPKTSSTLEEETPLNITLPMLPEA